MEVVCSYDDGEVVRDKVSSCHMSDEEGVEYGLSFCASPLPHLTYCKVVVLLQCCQATESVIRRVRMQCRLTDADTTEVRHRAFEDLL